MRDQEGATATSGCAYLVRRCLIATEETEAIVVLSAHAHDTQTQRRKGTAWKIRLATPFSVAQPRVG